MSRYGRRVFGSFVLGVRCCRSMETRPADRLCRHRVTCVLTRRLWGRSAAER
jgi:hypothetical protein